MPQENYQSAGEHIRNIADVPGGVEVLEEHPPFRIVRLAPPYYGGSALWIVNEKGFFWEPVADLEAAGLYLSSEEAQAYRASSGSN